MAFDNPTRNRLNSFVAECRNILSEEFTSQLKRDYGMDPDSGAVTDVAKLTQLNDVGRETARILRDTLQHYLAVSSADAKKARQEAMRRIIREQAFTVLNRLCALRMAEARKLFVESVGNGLQSQGFQLYVRLAGPALGESGDAYRCYLFSVFDELAVDLAVLFNRFSPEGRLFPSGTVLQEILSKLNAPEMVPLWEEDETIGWIYQYFNDPAERKKMRDESAAPRNSRELAVRNQFFTPRYVVEFLTDNTLGRIWYEMTQGQTSLKESCRYMVRRPDEVFLSRESTEPLSSRSRSLGIPAQESAPAETKKSAKKSAKAAAAATAVAKTEDATGKNAHPTTVAELLLTGTEETFPEFSATSDAQIQRMIEFAHSVDGYVRHPNEEESWQWLEELKRQHLEAMQYDGVATQDILDALFLTCRADRHGGDGTVYKERWFAAACDEVRRRVLNSRRTDLSQEELLKQPVFVPYREMKDPREIRMLDPACGSMHFGLYAFDLFEQIYLEFWQLSDPDNESSLLPRVGGEGGRRPDEGAFVPIHETFDSDRSFQSAIPKLIIEHNIHGIDIDRRATQIAGLSLWLRAQKSWQMQKVKPQDRPRIVRSNIVCAEPMPGNAELLEEFLQKHLSADAEGQLLTVLVRKVFEAMKLAGEAGSLLKIEEEIAGEVEKARQLWDNSREKKQQSLFDNRPKQVQQEMDFVRKIDDATFWDEAEDLIYAALRAYAEQAENGGGFQRRLFADDAARGFAFIDVCRKRYEVVLMNPPFGVPTVQTVSFLASCYPEIKTDLYGAFIDNALQRLNTGGHLGAITSRTGFFLASFQKWREEILLPKSQLDVLVDLGGEVLDTAMVETAAYAIRKSSSVNEPLSIFIRLSDYKDKMPVLLRTLAATTSGLGRGDVFMRFVSAFSCLERTPFCYWIPNHVLNLVVASPKFEPHSGKVIVGVQTDDDVRFVRHWTEVQSASLGASLRDSQCDRRWVTYLKGDSASPFYLDHELTLNWAKNGAELRAATESAPGGRVNNESDYYMPGISWTVRTDCFVPHIVPAGCIPSVSRYEALPTQQSSGDRLFLLALFSASIYDFIAKLQMEKWKQPKFIPGVVRNLPVPVVSAAVRESLEGFAKSAVENAMFLAAQSESSRTFAPSWLRDVGRRSLRTSYATQSKSIAVRITELDETMQRISSEVDGAFGLKEANVKWGSFLKPEEEEDGYEVVTPTTILQRRFTDSLAEFAIDFFSWAFGAQMGRWDIRFAVLTVCPRITIDPFDAQSACPPAQLTDSHGMPVHEGALQDAYPIQIPWDGIMLDDPGHALDIERRVREVIEIIWGEKVASGERRVASEAKEFAAAADSTPATPEAIEQEACEILGVRSLREYFQKPAKFFADHLKRYSKSRRQAPIYWPLSTESGGYTLWIYYHRLTDQTLFHAVNNFVEPKLKQVTDQLSRLKAKSGRSSAEEKELSTLTVLESELTDFRDELLRVARFWKPNLNDGVLITASPLWKLFRLPKWRKDLKACWDELEKGDYDWAHLALSIWPDRVVRTAHKDRSIAIAHDLESDLWHEVTITLPGRGKNAKPITKTEWQPRKLTESELDRIVQQVKQRPYSAS